MPYIDKHGRPELIAHPLFKTGYASPRTEPNDADDKPAQNGAADPAAPGPVRETPSTVPPVED